MSFGSDLIFLVLDTHTNPHTTGSQKSDSQGKKAGKQPGLKRAVLCNKAAKLLYSRLLPQPSVWQMKLFLMISLYVFLVVFIPFSCLLSRLTFIVLLCMGGFYIF